MQPTTSMLLTTDAIREYAAKNPEILTEEYPGALVAVVLVRGGMHPSGQPAVQMVVEIEGRKRLVSTSLQMLETIASGMRAASGMPRGP